MFLFFFFPLRQCYTRKYFWRQKKVSACLHEGKKRLLKEAGNLICSEVPPPVTPALVFLLSWSFPPKAPQDSLHSTLGNQQTHFKPLWWHSEHLKSQRKLRAYSLAGWMAVRHRASRTYAFETKAECAKNYCMSWESRGAFPASAARPQLLATSALTGLPLRGWSKTSNWSLWHWSVETTKLLRTQCLD